MKEFSEARQYWAETSVVNNAKKAHMLTNHSQQGIFDEMTQYDGYRYGDHGEKYDDY